ncbi:MAG: methyltransferase [Anaerolineae bacterium]|nr:methyltransferase [Anaerolineae bacterium]
MQTQPGVFSWEHLDAGTAFLLAQFPQMRWPQAPHLLDAGCGYGILGAVAAHEFAGAQLTWADDDLLAVGCVQAAWPGADVRAVDLTAGPLEVRFEGILCNPPFHQGREQDTAFMRQFAAHAAAMLEPGGQLWVVANRFLPYSALLEPHFDRVRPVAQDNRFQVWQAVRA